MLWKEVMRHMYKLWALADADLLDNPNAYQLWNTGQGLNRVQACPLVAAEMRRLLHKVQRESGPWVGLSVVHLGDRDVPNALVFIDKYAQVPRLLRPIATVVGPSLDAMAEARDARRATRPVPRPLSDPRALSSASLDP